LNSQPGEDMQAYGQTDVGCRRTVNQDAFYFDSDRALYIVADGMGGHQAGDLASRLAIRSILDFLNKQVLFDLDEPDLIDKLTFEMELCRSAVVCANTEIYRVAEEKPELFGMGTTIDMLKIMSGYAIICHVGDSRIYRFADGKIQQLTKDHTQLQELLDTQQLTQEEAQFSKIGNVITRALGGGEIVDVDTFIVPIKEKDVFLLCSDGLSGVMEDWEIREEFGMFDYDIQGVASSYIETTLERGAPDNVTVLVVGPADIEESISQNDQQDNAPEFREAFGNHYADHRS